MDSREEDSEDMEDKNIWETDKNKANLNKTAPSHSAPWITVLKPWTATEKLPSHGYWTDTDLRTASWSACSGDTSWESNMPASPQLWHCLLSSLQLWPPSALSRSRLQHWPISIIASTVLSLWYSSLSYAPSLLRTCISTMSAIQSYSSALHFVWSHFHYHSAWCILALKRCNTWKWKVCGKLSSALFSSTQCFR